LSRQIRLKNRQIAFSLLDWGCVLRHLFLEFFVSFLPVALPVRLIMPATENPVKNVVVHPLVLLSVVDHFTRMSKIGNQKRVVGVLLGGLRNKGVLDVSNSFAGFFFIFHKLFFENFFESFVF
jgi:hypothetical protein